VKEEKKKAKSCVVQDLFFVPQLHLDLEKNEASEENLLASVPFYTKNMEGIRFIVKKGRDKFKGTDARSSQGGSSLPFNG
jgi:hypothetical protein